MKNIHDIGYKKLFSNKTIFRQLLETFVNEGWVKDLDFDSCETLDKSFISDHYKETESDIIYKLNLKGKEVFVYVLIEFQSTVKQFMAVIVLNYITNFYMDYITSNKGIKKLPAIFPIVLYNGDRLWNAASKISELIEGNDLLGKYSINFEYFRICENEYSKESLLKIRNIVSMLFLAESFYDMDLLSDELLDLFEREEDKQAVSLFLNWFKQLSESGRIDKEDYKSLEGIYTNKREVKTMLIDAMEKEKKRIFEAGWKDGKTEGKLEGKIEDAKVMLLNGEPVERIKLYTKLSEEQILELKEEINLKE